jgi:hypothetical protein
MTWQVNASPLARVGFPAPAMPQIRLRVGFDVLFAVVKIGSVEIN